jgi:hypothetical protein
LGVAAIGALSLSGCKRDAESLGGALDSAVVGRAEAAAPASSKLWKERAAGDAVPEGVVPMGTLAPLVKTLKPGVVNVYTTSVVRARPQLNGADDPFEEFFRRFHQGAPED